jgi:hypothetical protein
MGLSETFGLIKIYIYIYYICTIVLSEFGQGSSRSVGGSVAWSGRTVSLGGSSRLGSVRVVRVRSQFGQGSSCSVVVI